MPRYRIRRWSLAEAAIGMAIAVSPLFLVAVVQAILAGWH